MHGFWLIPLTTINGRDHQNSVFPQPIVHPHVDEKNFKWKYSSLIGEDKNKKKCFFLVIRPLCFYPPYTNGLVVHATFLFFIHYSLIIAWTDFDNFFFFFPIFGIKQPDFREKKCFFAQWLGGFTIHKFLVVRPLKKKKLLFFCVFPYFK